MLDNGLHLFMFLVFFFIFFKIDFINWWINEFIASLYYIIVIWHIPAAWKCISPFVQVQYTMYHDVLYDAKDIYLSSVLQKVGGFGGGGGGEEESDNAHTQRSPPTPGHYGW